MEYMGIEPQMVYFKSSFFQAHLEEIEESFREKTLFIENKKLGRKEGIFQISILFGYTDVLYDLLQKAKKMVTWYAMGTGRGDGDSCGKKEESKRDCKEMLQSMSQLAVSL